MTEGQENQPQAPAPTTPPATAAADSTGKGFLDRIIAMISSFMPSVGGLFSGFANMLGGAKNFVMDWLGNSLKNMAFSVARSVGGVTAATMLATQLGVTAPDPAAAPQAEKTIAQQIDEEKLKAVKLEVQERTRRLSGDFSASASGSPAAPVAPATTQAFNGAGTPTAPATTTPGAEGPDFTSIVLKPGQITF